MNIAVIVLMALDAHLAMAADDRSAASDPVTMPRLQQAQSAPPVRHEGEAGDALWIRGIVRNANGHGLPASRIFARSLFNGGIRLYEEVRSAVTDDRGAYEIHGPAHSTLALRVAFMAPINVIVSAKGYPPAMATAARPRNDDGPVTLDVTVGGGVGAASVTVLKDGKPLANASVALNLELTIYSVASRGYVGAAQGGTDRDALDDVISPTGPDRR